MIVKQVSVLHVLVGQLEKGPGTNSDWKKINFSSSRNELVFSKLLNTSPCKISHAEHAYSSLGG